MRTDLAGVAPASHAKLKWERVVHGLFLRPNSYASCLMDNSWAENPIYSQHTGIVWNKRATLSMAKDKHCPYESDFQFVTRIYWQNTWLIAYEPERVQIASDGKNIVWSFEMTGYDNFVFVAPFNLVKWPWIVSLNRITLWVGCVRLSNPYQSSRWSAPWYLSGCSDRLFNFLWRQVRSTLETPSVVQTSAHIRFTPLNWSHEPFISPWVITFQTSSDVATGALIVQSASPAQAIGSSGHHITCRFIFQNVFLSRGSHWPAIPNGTNPNLIHKILALSLSTSSRWAAKTSHNKTIRPITCLASHSKSSREISEVIHLEVSCMTKTRVSAISDSRRIQKRDSPQVAFLPATIQTCWFASRGIHCDQYSQAGLRVSREKSRHSFSSSYRQSQHVNVRGLPRSFASINYQIDHHWIESLFHFISYWMYWNIEDLMFYCIQFQCKSPRDLGGCEFCQTSA
jgi:hypothetical protein